MKNQDLLDLCRLNQMESLDSVRESKDFKKLILLKKKQLSHKIITNAPTYSKKQIAQIKINKEKWEKYVENSEEYLEEEGKNVNIV